MDTSNAGASVSDPTRKVLATVKRQYRSPELKLKIVHESLAPGASVARVARTHGVNANQVFTWRRLYRQGRLRTGNRAMPGLLAVRVAEAPCVPELASGRGVEGRPKGTEARRMPAGRAGTIQIELPKGRLRVTGSVDRETLRVVLEALRA